MLSIILGALTGLAGPISTIVSKIIDLQAAKTNATTEIEKAQIDQQIQEAHDRQAVLIAEAGSRIGVAINASVRLLLALGPVLYLDKILIWDKVIGSWPNYTTDPLDSNLWWVVFSAIAFYFMYDISSRMVRK